MGMVPQLVYIFVLGNMLIYFTQFYNSVFLLITEINVQEVKGWGMHLASYWSLLQSNLEWGGWDLCDWDAGLEQRVQVQRASTLRTLVVPGWQIFWIIRHLSVLKSECLFFTYLFEVLWYYNTIVSDPSMFKGNLQRLIGAWDSGTRYV